MPRRSLSGFRDYAPFLGVQSKLGVAETYSGQFTTNQVPLSDRTGVGALPMQLAYTPPVDAWWEVCGFIGLVNKIDANYNYGMGQLVLAPADADGSAQAVAYAMQHQAVQTYEPRVITRIWKLTAGVAYVCQLGLNIAGGTWTYYCGPSQLYIQGKAWAR